MAVVAAWLTLAAVVDVLRLIDMQQIDFITPTCYIMFSEIFQAAGAIVVP